MKFTGPNTMEYKEVIEGMGTSNNTLTFCEQGVQCLSKSVEKNCQHTFNFHRVFDMDGTWRVCGKVEMDEGFCTPMGPSFNLKEFFENPTFKMDLQMCDEGYMAKDTFDDQCIVTKAKWGEEVENALCKGQFDLTVKTGPGSFKTVSKKDGNIMESTMECCGDNKLKFTMKDKKTGKMACANMEKFCDFSGKYKIVSSSGMADFCKASGVKDVAETVKMFADPSFEYVVKETGCFLDMCSKYQGKVVHKMAASYGEELTTTYPFIEKPFYVVSTKSGNCITIISKGPTYTIKSMMKRTKNFLIACDEVVGTGVKQTQICVVC